MRAASTLSVIGTALWLAALPAHAVGFGRITNATQLGQPLNFAAALRVDADEVLSRECVSAEVQSGENRLQSGQIRVTLEGSADSPERSVRVSTSTLIDEPVVTVSVTVGCTAKVTRRFVAFIDPPLINLAQSAAAAEPLPPQRVDSQVAPIVALVQGEGSESSAPPSTLAGASPPSQRLREPVATGVPARPPPERTATAAVPKPRRVASAPRPVPVVRGAAAGPRLQLETAPPVVAQNAASAASMPAPATAATPPAVLAAAAAASAAPAGEAVEQLARERQRIQALEEGLAKLRSDSQNTQSAMAALQARLNGAEAERYANPLVYALAWISALLALVVAVLWWRQSRLRPPSQWWVGPGAARLTSRLPADAAISAPPTLGAPATQADAFTVAPVVDLRETLATASLPPTRPAPFLATAPAPAPLPDPTPQLPRELSVEELIDLEQQVEFFIVLGQDEAAIELLMSHVRSDGGISPLPYLKLLEIYRRRGDGDAYQRIRERFNRRFNSYAPDWESDLQHGRSLADYPDTIARLQALWSSPVRAMETLDASLFRRNSTDETFELPAYRELLFLYSIARDLAEHGGTLPVAGIDLLLPFDEPGEEPISRLTATTKSGDLTASGDFQPSDLMTMPLDLDVSFAGGADEPAFETRPSAVRRAPAASTVADSTFVDFDLDAPDTVAKPGRR